MKKIISLAENLGAEIQVCKYESNVEVTAIAPNGKQWNNGQCIHMTEEYYTYIKGDRDECYKTLLLRMSVGLEELDEELNP